jgi:hypothetical protein
MSSRQKRKIARQNGAKAAGSKSPAGIQKSALNATKHGLTGKAIVLSNESQVHFDELHLTYVEEFRPESGVEMDLIDQMVAAQWRLRRIWRMQTAALDLAMDQQQTVITQKFKQIDQATRTTVAFTTMADEHHTLELFLRYETAYARMHQRALNTLLKLRKEKLRNDPEPPSEPPSIEANPEETNEPSQIDNPTKALSDSSHSSWPKNPGDEITQSLFPTISATYEESSTTAERPKS